MSKFRGRNGEGLVQLFGKLSQPDRLSTMDEKGGFVKDALLDRIGDGLFEALHSSEREEKRQMGYGALRSRFASLEDELTQTRVLRGGTMDSIEDLTQIGDAGGESDLAGKVLHEHLHSELPILKHRGE